MNYTKEQESDIQDRVTQAYIKGLEKSHSMSPDTKNEFTRLDGLVEGVITNQARTDKFLTKVSWIVVSLLFGMGSWVATIQAELRNNTEHITVHSNQLENINESQRSNDIVSADIKARLVSIELTLKEIKQGLKITK